MKHVITRSALIGALALASSCLQRPVDPEGIFAPVGTLTGTITDGYDQQPIEGAKITINYNGSSQTVTTDKTGSYSFQNIPATFASGLSNGGGYQTTLDLSAVKGDRKYKPFRTSTINVVFGELRRSGDTTSTNSTVQESTPVGYLVSNLSFTVRQTRGIVSGIVQDKDLKPLANIKFALVLNQGGGAIRNGATAALVTSGADGKFSVNELEEGLQYRLDLLDQTWSNLNTNAVFNYLPSSPFQVLDLGAETVLRPIVLVQRAASDQGNTPFVTSTDPAEDAILAPGDIAKPVVIKFNKPMNQSRGLDAVALTNGFRRIGPRNRPDDNVALNIIFQPSWNTAGTELTLTPNAPLEAGYRYVIDFNPNFLFDTTNNQRNTAGQIPFTDPVQVDALAIANGTNDLQFSIGSDSMPLTVSNLVQEADTADNNGGANPTRAFTIEGDPSSTENSFRTALNAPFFQDRSAGNNPTNYAYITWTAPSKPVRRYRVWTRVGTNTPILISVTNASNPWGIGGDTRREPLAPAVLGYSIPLSDLSTILNAETAGLPGVGLANTTWDNALSVQLGVSAVNSDGQEGDITFITLQDNTGPALAIGSGLGRTTQYQNTNDSVLLSRAGDCSGLSVTADRVSCQKVSNTITGAPAATTFGQRVVVFDLSEPVDAASVVAANITLEDGTLPNNLNNNMNVAGAQTESDATIASAFPVSVVNGRATRIGVLFNNFFGIDTGDRLILRTGTTGTTGVKDIVGNVSKDVLVNRTPFVDNFPPMIKSVTLDAANDTATVVFTKWVNASNEPAPAPTAARPTPGNFDFNRFALNLSNGDNFITQATHSINSNNESQVVLKFTDLGYFRGFNSTDSACLTGTNNTGVGTRITMNNVESIDFTNTTTRSTASVTDDGTVAYENMLPDSAAPFQSPGAYLPSSGVGTRSSTNDTIPPRLSSNYARRTLGTCSNGAASAVLANNGTSNRAITVALTEFTANDTSATATDSVLNPANWEVKLVDLGTTGTTCNDNVDNTDRWNGKTGASLGAAAEAVVVINSVTLNTTDGSGCGRSPRYDLNITITNQNTANARFLAIGSVKLKGATVADRAGNALGAAPARVTWSYDPARADQNNLPPSANPVPGWVVVP